jgi:hypothetical protein
VVIVVCATKSGFVYPALYKKSLVSFAGLADIHYPTRAMDVPKQSDRETFGEVGTN